MSTSPSDLVQELYIAAYGRPADPSGLQYWTNVLNQNGGNVNAILPSFTSSTEANNLYGTINSSDLSTVINNIYENLFGRSVDPSGLQYWENAYNTDQMSVGSLAYDIMQGAQNSDATTINNKIATADAITNYLTNNPNVSLTQSEVPLLQNFLQSVSSSVPSSSSIQNFLNTANDENIVQSLYIAFYDRPADPSGLQYWANELAQNGNNINAILPSFANSTESASLYGNVPSTPDLNTLISNMDNYFTNLFSLNGETPPNLQGLNSAITSYYQDYANGNLSNVTNDFANILAQFDTLMTISAAESGITLTPNDLQPLNTLITNEYLTGNIPTESDLVNAFDAFLTNAANTNNQTLSSSDLAQINSAIDSAYQSEFSAMQSQITSIDNMINTIYENLFGRAADPSGLQYWQNIYTHTPNMNPGLLAYDILQSAGGSDVNTIQDKIAVANEATLLYQNNPSVSYDATSAKDLISSSSLPAISDIASILNLSTTPATTSTSSSTTNTTATTTNNTFQTYDINLQSNQTISNITTNDIVNVLSATSSGSSPSETLTLTPSDSNQTLQLNIGSPTSNSIALNINTNAFNNVVLNSFGNSLNYNTDGNVLNWNYVDSSTSAHNIDIRGNYALAMTLNGTFGSANQTTPLTVTNVFNASIFLGTNFEGLDNLAIGDSTVANNNTTVNNLFIAPSYTTMLLQDSTTGSVNDYFDVHNALAGNTSNMLVDIAMPSSSTNMYLLFDSNAAGLGPSTSGIGTITTATVTGSTLYQDLAQIDALGHANTLYEFSYNGSNYIVDTGASTSTTNDDIVVLIGTASPSGAVTQVTLNGTTYHAVAV